MSSSAAWKYKSYLNLKKKKKGLSLLLLLSSKSLRSYIYFIYLYILHQRWCSVWNWLLSLQSSVDRCLIYTTTVSIYFNVRCTSMFVENGIKCFSIYIFLTILVNEKHCNVTLNDQTQQMFILSTEHELQPSVWVI